MLYENHIDLNNDWRYSNTFQEEMCKNSYDDNNMEIVRIPHANVITPYHYFDEKMYQFISCYRKHIDVKPDWKGKLILLTFEGVAHIAKVYVNETLVTVHYGGYTAFTAEISSYLDYTHDNFITVVVDSREDNNLPPFGNVIDYMTYGGIYREVYLEVKEPVYIEDAFIISTEAEFDQEGKPVNNLLYDEKDSPKKFWNVEMIIKLNKHLESDLTLKYSILRKDYNKNVSNRKDCNKDDMNEKPVLENNLLLNNKSIDILMYNQVSDNTFRIVETVSDIRTWEITDPNLYELHLELYNTSVIKDQKQKEIREINNSLNLNYSSENQIDMQNPIHDMDNQIGRQNPIHESEDQDGRQNSIVDSEWNTDSMIDKKLIRFGFRTCEFKEDGFYLNHKKIKLIGLNRHQSYPYVGYAMPKRMQRRDADILKQELGVNAVRTSHYPQSRHFIDRCDELGLLVFTEIPGWQHIGNEDWKKIACENVREMVIQYRNHPSIILWGVRINESQDDDAFYSKTNQIAHDLDKTRQTGGVRFLKKSRLLEDVYTYNDFLHNGSTKGIDKKKDVTSDNNAPYLVSEYNGHMYPAKVFDNEEHRLIHALRHARVLDAILEQDGVAGGFGWCMFDYNTHKDFGSGDRICYHGVMDMFRNPKLAAAVYKSQNEEEPVFEISSSMEIGEHPAGYIGDIYAFTNADSIKLYKNNELINEFYPCRTEYPSLIHAPIQIDDLVGNLIEKQESMSHKSAETIKQVLFAVSKYGQNSLPLKYKLKMLQVMMKEKLNFSDGVRLYSKYIANWGGSVTEYHFEAIKNNEVIKTIEKKPMNKPALSVDIDTVQLTEAETYDVSGVRLTVIDESGNRLPYYQEPLTLEAMGAIEIIGPKIISLKGGAGGTYVKTVRIKGEGVLSIYNEQLGETRIIYQVT